MEMFSMPREVILWSRLCLAMFIWFCYLEWMLYGGDLLTLKIYIKSRGGNSFGLGPHFCQQNKHIPLKKMIIWTTCKAVSFFSNIARVQYSIIPLIYIYIYFYKVGEVCTDIAPTNSRANYIRNDFDQETGQ